MSGDDRLDEPQFSFETTAVMTFGSRIKVSEVKNFLGSIPDDADIELEAFEGNGRERSQSKIIATWTPERADV